MPKPGERQGVASFAGYGLAERGLEIARQADAHEGPPTVVTDSQGGVAGVAGIPHGGGLPGGIGRRRVQRGATQKGTSKSHWVLPPASAIRSSEPRRAWSCSSQSASTALRAASLGGAFARLPDARPATPSATTIAQCSRLHFIRSPAPSCYWWFKPHPAGFRPPPFGFLTGNDKPQPNSNSFATEDRENTEQIQTAKKQPERKNAENHRLEHRFPQDFQKNAKGATPAPLKSKGEGRLGWFVHTRITTGPYVRHGSCLENRRVEGTEANRLPGLRCRSVRALCRFASVPAVRHTDSVNGGGPLGTDRREVQAQWQLGQGENTHRRPLTIWSPSK